MTDADAGPDLPDGFDDAPHAVQVALLETYQGTALVQGICDELDIEPPRTSQLQKRHKARIYLRLRDTGRVLPDADGYRRGELSAEFDTVVEHDQEAEADGGAVASSQPAAWVADAAETVTHESPETVQPVTPDAVEYDDTEPDEDDDLVTACPDCDNSTVYARETKPESERWRCGDCGAEFPEPVRRPSQVEHPDNESPSPDWLARDPNEIVAAANMNRSLGQVISAISSGDDLLYVKRRLSYKRGPDSMRAHLLQPLGLLGDDGDIIDDDTLDDRLTVLGEWVDDE